MWEFTVRNKTTNQENIIFGYNERDAFRRAGYNIEEWETLYYYYVD